MAMSCEPTASAAPPSFEWKRWPETEAFVDRLVEQALAGQCLRPLIWPSG